MFAVIKSGGKQYRVGAEDVLTVEKLAGEAGDTVEFAEVLMVGEGADATVGTPFVEGARVMAEVVDQGRARKVIAFKKRRRQNSKRTRGHRQHQTVVKIGEILTNGAEPSKKASATKTPAASKTDGAKADTKAGQPGEPTLSNAAPADKGALFTAPVGDGDDLTKIKGVGKVAAKQLNEQGITTFVQIAGLSDADIERVDEAMPFSAAQLQDWREQAKELAK
ncbi:50S ribosomal protein L21 [Pararhizobium mangrovi]|uniref:Large ribosomal subunit protein bL21 n=1 Tax=Pararhizobium mangrovi TaxID=2590452 RepID=A0A506TWW7_9HYPH|nr:50S ribosomal protein L21 [Pararhizobium mangrovi]TPW26532.1 50S ribosomal protein L21 [Pararhizobium mangrovi]